MLAFAGEMPAISGRNSGSCLFPVTIKPRDFQGGIFDISVLATAHFSVMAWLTGDRAICGRTSRSAQVSQI